MSLDLGELVARITVDGEKATADLSAFTRELAAVSQTRVPAVELDADTSGALASLSELTSRLTGIPNPDVEVAADTASALADLSRLEADLRALPDGDAAVDADVAAALADLARLEAQVRSLPDGDLDVDADTSGARGALDDLNRDAAAGGAAAGDEAGDGLAAGVIAAIATIPVAGAVVGIGVAIGKSLLDGLQNEVREDRLAAATGLDAASVRVIAAAAGEAYANNFGESIEANLGTARAAIEGGLLDPEATGRDTQVVIEQLSGVADILGVDVAEAARAAGVLIRTGLADNASDAFDIIVAGSQAGLNVSGDLLEVLTEYSTQFRKLGLDGPTALGLIQQGLQGGARDADLVADALKEFSIRAIDGSALTSESFRLAGVDADEFAVRITEGGASASSALDDTLKRVLAIEDPVKRNTAGVGLFGTQWEDLGAAVNGLDVSSASASFRDLDGAASGAIATLGDNEAGEIASAFRNIEVAADGIKGALAAAFGDQISGFADTVRENREGVVSFLLDLANGGFDMARALVEASASGVEAFGDLGASTEPVLDAIASVVEGAADVAYAMGNRGLSAELRAAANGIRLTADDLGGLDESSAKAADALRTNLITNGLDPMQEKLNEVGIDQQTQAKFSDATVKLANSVAEIGLAADGSALQMFAFEDGSLQATDAGRRLDAQLRTATEALDAQVVAGQEAGRSVADLSADYGANREALLRSIEAMGFSRKQAEKLADSYGAVPGDVRTEFLTPGSPRAADEAARVRKGVRDIPGTARTDYSTPGSGSARDAADTVANYVERVPGRASTSYFTPGSGDARDAANTVRNYVDQVPGRASTSYFAPGSSDTRRAADAVRGAVNNIPGSASTSIVLKGAQAAISALQATSREVRALDGSTATYYVRSEVQGSARTGNGVTNARAEGGPVWPGEPFLVGEEGPELVTFAGEGNVVPADETAAILARGMSNVAAVAVGGGAGGGVLRLADADITRLVWGLADVMAQRPAILDGPGMSAALTRQQAATMSGQGR